MHDKLSHSNCAPHGEIFGCRSSNSHSRRSYNYSRQDNCAYQLEEVMLKC